MSYSRANVKRLWKPGDDIFVGTGTDCCSSYECVPAVRCGGGQLLKRRRRRRRRRLCIAMGKALLLGWCMTELMGDEEIREKAARERERDKRERERERERTRSHL